jgi:hypothetical protein
MKNTADVADGKPIAVLLQSMSNVSAINPLVAFTTPMEERERCYSFILSLTPPETKLHLLLYYDIKLYLLLYHKYQISQLSCGVRGRTKE